MTEENQSTDVEVIPPKAGKLAKRERKAERLHAAPKTLPDFATALRIRASDEELFKTLSPHGQLIVPRVLNELARLLDPEGHDGVREQLTVPKRFLH